MSTVLAVWINGVRVAEIEERKGRPRLTYTQDALDRFELGNPLLSLSLPLITEPYPQGVTRAFIEGLLPEGESRRNLSRELGLRENDTFGLIAALGRDCAGAIVIQPIDEPPPAPATTLTAARLSDAEIADLVANLRSAPLGVGGRVRISLAGVQEKLLLTRMPDGSWGRPIDGTPSTHILKPEIIGFPSTVENEAFCMRLAKLLGLDVATIETTAYASRKLIVVERFDRIVAADGAVTRLHQEDFCQATGTQSVDKYEENGGPSFRTIARILQTVAPLDSVESLLRAMVLYVLVGNGDAHAKNFSLLHLPTGELRLAPLYDILSTRFYNDQRLAMRIDGLSRADRVTTERLSNEATSWGLSRRRVNDVIADLIDRIPAAVALAVEATPGLPAEIPGFIMKQLLLR